MTTKREVSGLLLLSLLWGSTWAAIRVTVTHMPPLRSVSLRFLLASTVLIPCMLLSKSRLPRGREWVLLAALAVLMTALPFSLIAWTQRRMSSGITSILFASSPLLTLWMETWIGGTHRKRHVPRRAVLGTAIGLGGVVLVLLHAAVAAESYLLPGLVVLLVVALGSASTIVAKLRLKQIPVATVAGVETLMAGLVVGALSLVFERRQPTEWTEASLAAMLFLGLVSSALCFLLFYWLLMRMEPHQLAVRYLLMPIVAIGEGALLLGERIAWTEVAGAVAVLISVALLLSAGTGNREGDPVEAREMAAR